VIGTYCEMLDAYLSQLKILLRLGEI